MNAIKATWKQGCIVPAEPVDWPEGSELVVEPLMAATEKMGLEEAEWRDDPQSIADWEEWVQTIEPRMLTDEERVAFAQYREDVRRHNLEAVRRQMAAGDCG